MIFTLGNIKDYIIKFPRFALLAISKNKEYRLIWKLRIFIWFIKCAEILMKSVSFESIVPTKLVR